MTGDPLDRIEDHFATLWAAVVWGQAQTDALTRIQERTEALVEVARAARDLTDDPFGQLDARRFYRLREALARMDGPR